ncbi:MAG: hypothetical protein ACYCOU_00740 [Sulfobacillus sp.]
MSPGYRRCNPSLMRTSDGYLVAVRSVNYQIVDDHTYQPKDPYVHTETYLAKYDAGFKLQGLPKRMVDRTSVQQHPGYIRGFEDVRIFSACGRHWFTATSGQSSAVGLETVLGEFTPRNAVIHRAVPAQPRSSWKKEKNWLPFSYGEEIRVIYLSRPLTVHRLFPDGSFEVVVKHEAPAICEGFRGSAGPVETPDGGFLYLVHEADLSGDWKYSHRWVKLDQEFRVRAMSPPFFWISPGIEFACGLCLAHDDDSLWVTFGVRDAEAYRLKVALANVHRELENWTR